MCVENAESFVRLLASAVGADTFPWAPGRVSSFHSLGKFSVAKPMETGSKSYGVRGEIGRVPISWQRVARRIEGDNMRDVSRLSMTNDI